MNPAARLVDCIARRAQRESREVSLVCGAASLGAAEVDERSTRLAWGMRRLGVEPGDRVALLFANGVELPLCLLACWKAQAVATPVNVRFAPPEVGYVLQHSGARMLVGDRALCEAIERAGAFDLPLGTIRVAAPESTAGEPALEQAFGELAACELPRVPAEAAAVILYTSGSTARPKGVVHTHASLRHMGGTYPTDLPQPARICVMTPLFHISGLYLWSKTLVDGSTAVLMPGFDPHGVLETIERRRCEATLGLPLMFHALLTAQRARPRDVACCSAWLAGGDGVPPSLQSEWQTAFSHPLLEGFGLTEMMPAFGNTLLRLCVGSIGTPSPGVEARVCDDEGRDLPDDQAGNLLLRAGHVFAEYWRDPHTTAATLRDGWLWTGDLASRDADGTFWFRGRVKQLIVRGGAKIAPQEVEAALLEHPAVAEAAVVGKPDPTYGETVAAFVVLRPGRTTTADELAEFPGHRLAAYKTPETVVFLEALPKGLTGKADRRLLKQRLADEKGTGAYIR